MGLGTILIRADASATMGAGHLMRCLALAQEWKHSGGDAIFAVAQSLPALEARLVAEGWRIARIEAAAGAITDANSAIEIARRYSAGWIVLDGYHFDCAYQSKIKKSGLKLLLLDDLGGAGRFAADLIVNQNAHADEQMYANREAYTRALLGPRFALLRREFRTQAAHARRAESKRVLITMGGSDPENASGKILEAVRSIPVESLEVAVIVGPGSRAPLVGDRLQDGCAVQIVRNPPSLIEYMQWADVAVSAAGTTVLEMCRAGLPMVLLSVAENQVRGTIALARRGVVKYLGPVHEVSQCELSDAVRALLCSKEARDRMSLLGQELVDGNGARRVVGAMLSANLQLRRASFQDCDLLWEWANEASVRAASFHSEAISRDEHREWFASKLRAENARIYVAEDQSGSAVGQFRVEWRTTDEAAVHVSIAAEKRGLGIGGELIRRAMEMASRETATRRFHAYIKPENKASLRAFEKAGFTRVESQPGAIHCCFEVPHAEVENEASVNLREWLGSSDPLCDYPDLLRGTS